jgi:hypothetical protein
MALQNNMIDGAVARLVPLSYRMSCGPSPHSGQANDELRRSGASDLFWTKQIGGWNVQIQGADRG